MQTVTTIGLDIAKSVFQVHAIDAEGHVIVHQRRIVTPASLATMLLNLRGDPRSRWGSHRRR